MVALTEWRMACVEVVGTLTGPGCLRCRAYHLPPPDVHSRSGWSHAGPADTRRPHARLDAFDCTVAAVVGEGNVVRLLEAW